jgi:glycyl-tRNA synthetase beta chain
VPKDEAQQTAFLLEIGCEEIPARFLDAAQHDLGERIASALAEARLVGNTSGVETYSTPRRLTVHIPSILCRQPSRTEEITGPPAKAAFDQYGQPTRAAESFAAKYSMQVADLRRVTRPKGEYLALEVRQAGREALQVLVEVIPVAIGRLSFPKNMYWTAKSGVRFVRPIRWILALLGEGGTARVIPFEFAGVKSGDETHGHRIIGPGSVHVHSFVDYAGKLRERGVEFDPAWRRRLLPLFIDVSLRAAGKAKMAELTMSDQPVKHPEVVYRVAARIIEKLPERADFRIVQDPELEAWHVNSTEHPRALLGEFDERFLRLPREVLITVMRDHQKYFAVEDPQGNLRPYFVAVLNTGTSDDTLIKRGHERVLAARFTDAEFFWAADQRIPLRDRAPMLARVVYQEKLGTYANKVERVRGLALEICAQLEQRGGISVTDQQTALRAIELCKCDLTTQMVQEFTELQGVVGGLYAQVQGEPAEVAEAIYDHYKPANMEDSCPRSIAGAVVALADKLDTVVAGFWAGLDPTGSSDPFGLRRAGNGVVKIAAKRLSGLNLDQLTHLHFTENLRAGAGSPKEKDAEHFLQERVEYYLRDVVKLRYDTTRSVANSTLGWTDPSDAVLRGRALEKFIDSADYRALSLAAKRTRNILVKSAAEYEAGMNHLKPELMTEPEEQSLYRAFTSIQQRMIELETQRSYETAFRELGGMRQPIDDFFDRVLVMAEQPDIRANRLALLASINAHVFSRLADLSEVATEPGSMAGEGSLPTGDRGKGA